MVSCTLSVSLSTDKAVERQSSTLVFSIKGYCHRKVIIYHANVLTTNKPNDSLITLQKIAVIMAVGLWNYFYHLADKRFSCETHKVANHTSLSRLSCTANMPFSRPSSILAGLRWIRWRSWKIGVCRKKDIGNFLRMGVGASRMKLALANRRRADPLLAVAYRKEE